MRIARSLMMATALTAVLGTACGSSKSNSGAPTTASTVAASTTTLDPTAAKAEITAAFTKFFNGANPDQASKLAVLQKGSDPAIQAVFTKGFATPAAALTFVKVPEVDLLSTSDCGDNGYLMPCATVHFDLYLKSNPNTAVLTSAATSQNFGCRPPLP